jgi:hypothetical protein
VRAAVTTLITSRVAAIIMLIVRIGGGI